MVGQTCHVDGIRRRDGIGGTGEGDTPTTSMVVKVVDGIF